MNRDYIMRISSLCVILRLHVCARRYRNMVFHELYADSAGQHRLQSHGARPAAAARPTHCRIAASVATYHALRIGARSPRVPLQYSAPLEESIVAVELRDALLFVERDALLYDRLDRPAEHAVEAEVTASYHEGVSVSVAKRRAATRTRARAPVEPVVGASRVLVVVSPYLLRSRACAHLGPGGGGGGSGRADDGPAARATGVYVSRVSSDHTIARRHLGDISRRYISAMHLGDISRRISPASSAPTRASPPAPPSASCTASRAASTSPALCS